ncbi:hypothetical protein XVE_2469 [Xanthomonas vesicatoria ATCC 35937]|uniref:Uncharacterized protein n=1 Tax=Xanthomonas vesicatoria ATCC 35937 TaxID=925775 RepID=F0BE42_9XANT|nr:hypothetical protein XVE_2469 [Xanthomonas vesicatoria ATCC 35937]
MAMRRVWGISTALCVCFPKHGSGKGGTSRKQTSRDHLADIVAAGKNCIIPEAQHLEAFALQKGIARGVRAG